MSTAIERLHAAVNRPGLRSLAAGLTMSLADGVEILATVEHLHDLLEARCEDHYRCDECGAVVCEACKVGEPAPCAHHNLCLDHYPALGDRECEEAVAEQAAYDRRDRPWGAPA